ncbi:DUF349 domain-containing protein [Vallicoccus soli]|uniref:DUF349 domain-containing protein n=1 Tax=Vallicoccus soli TaxID=2339232 RepID=A0A3A3Z282_9ACTN|nr:DUF349 domain-containing protein [Vallicoccus soli]RJK96789.1 DUF349 domain-containing protein [Vallicoccus soli]
MSSSEWGRVDEAGTVWVRVADGEREVGSYPGATPEEALAYFGRKYDELAGQITLLEQRVRTTDLAAKDALASIAKLHETLAQAHAVGDLGALAGRLAALVTLVEERKGTQDAARAKAREEARSRKEAIVSEAETLATSTSWKASGDRLRALLDDWKAAPRLDRKTDDALWKRFSAARNAFDRARRHHFANLDAQRDEVKQVKERIVREAEALQDSTDWGATAGAYRDLMTRWKAAGRAGKADEERLWQAFRAAQDRFFAARNATFSQRDAEQRENLAAKEGIAAEAEALLPVTDLAAAKAALRGLQERWESIGHVPRDARPTVEGRLRRVEDAVRDAEEAQWRRSNPEARARAEATVAQLQASIAKLEADAQRAEAAGNAKKAADARAGLEARQAWLVEAEKALAEFTG